MRTFLLTSVTGTALLGVTGDAIIAVVGVVLAASIPAYFTYRTAHMNRAGIEEIRRQVLPENGTRLAQFIAESHEAVADLKVSHQRDYDELKNLLRDIRFDQKRHQYTYRHERNLVDEDSSDSLDSKHESG